MDNFLQQIKSNWVIIIFTGSILVGWTTFDARLTQAENDIVDLKIAITDINNLKVQLQRIDTSVEFIKNRVK